MNPDQLRNALANVKEHGFGESVDHDSIIEEAARLHLAYVSPAEDYWTAHADKRDDWKYEVNNGDTLLGFHQWVAYQAEDEECVHTFNVSSFVCDKCGIDIKEVP